MAKHIMATTVLWFVLAGALPLTAQQNSEYTLGSLWPVVEKNYPGIRAKTSAIAAAEFHEKAVKSNMLPQLRAQAQNTYGTFEGSSGAFFPQAGFFNVSGPALAPGGSSAAANTFVSATVEWELFSFGKLRKDNEAANALYSKSLSEREAYVLNLKKILSERYINLLYNDARVEWSRKNASRLEDIRKITSALSAAGLKPAADSLLASSSYMQALGEYDKWNGLKNASLIKVSEFLGTDFYEVAAPSKRFADPAENTQVPAVEINASHPILDALDKQSEYYELSGEAQKRATLPSVKLLGGYAHRGTAIGSGGTVSGAWTDGFNNTTNNFLAGIGVTWSITNLHTNDLKSKELFKEAESNRYLHSQYSQAMQADLTASQAKIKQQFQQLQKTKVAVQQSQDAYQMYMARYKSGLLTLNELLQIRILQEQAENAHIEASRDYWMLLAYEAELTADFDFLFNNL